MAKRLLREDARAQQRRQVPLAAARMLRVDEGGERVEDDVLGESEPDGERPRRDGRPAPHRLEAEPEERAVPRVEDEAALEAEQEVLAHGLDALEAPPVELLGHPS